MFTFQFNPFTAIMTSDVLRRWFLHVCRTSYDLLLQFLLFMHSKLEHSFRNKHFWPEKNFCETVLVRNFHKQYKYCGRERVDTCNASHHHQSLNSEGRWGTTDDFATNFLHFSLFSTALWDLPNSRPVHSLMLSSHLFLCPPCLLPPFTVPCKMVLARPDERET